MNRLKRQADCLMQIVTRLARLSSLGRPVNPRLKPNPAPGRQAITLAKRAEHGMDLKDPAKKGRLGNPEGFSILAADTHLNPIHAFAFQRYQNGKRSI